MCVWDFLHTVLDLTETLVESTKHIWNMGFEELLDEYMEAIHNGTPYT